MSEKKIDLITKLLAKAESTTPEEAEALTAAAEKLMVQLGIDMAVIDERRANKGQASEKIVEERLEFTGAYRGEFLHLAHSVSLALGLRGMQNTGQNNGKIFSYWIIGFESDVARAKLLIESLQVQSAVAVRAFWKLNKDVYQYETSYNQEKARRSFVYGFGSGAGRRIKDNRLQAVSEVTTGTELVLVSRTEKVDAYVEEKNLRKSRGRNAAAGGGASGHGYQAGQNANTGERSMTQGRGITV